jgi:hypothetical protein
MFYNVFTQEEGVVKMKSNLLEVETLAYSKPGEAPRPVTFRFMINDEYMKGSVKKIRDKKEEKLAGNVMYTYLCDAVVEDRATTVKMKYERDTMKWYIFNL